MSLFSSCKRGKLDGVKRALSRGEMEALSCGEKLKCVNAALQTKRNGDLMETLMEHLDLDQINQLEQIRDGLGSNRNANERAAAISFVPKTWAFFESFHSNCVKRTPASGDLSGLDAKLLKPGKLILKTLPALSEEKAEQVIRDNDCIPNTRSLVQLHRAMKAAVKDYESKRNMIEEEMKNEIEGSKNAKRGEKTQVNGQLRMEKKRKERKKKNKDKERKTDNTSENVSNEKVRVKVGLRSRISDLELEK